MENYLIAAAIATLAPGLVIKGITAGVSSVWYLGNRAVYGKQKTKEEETIDKMDKLEKLFEERLLEISNREKNIDVKLDALLKQNYKSSDSKSVDSKSSDSKSSDD